MQAGYPEHRGCCVRLLRNGNRIFPAMLEAIHRAEHAIFLETFIYWSGDIGERFAEALAAKARQGLDVRIILDWVGCLEMHDSLAERMQAAGVQVLHFRPLRWFSLRRFNHRTHRKLMVTDGTTGFIGGVGIADSWDGDAQDPDHWRDNHYLVTGPVVRDFQDLFLHHWKSDQPPPHPPPTLPDSGPAAAQVIASEPSAGRHHVLEAFIACINRAQHRLAIVTPYFLPCKGLLTALRSALHRGVEVRILTCGKHIDRSTVRHASRHTWGHLLADGMQIHEFQPTLLHSKTLLIDDTEVFLGSANFDCRSCLINSEANLLVRHPATVNEHWTMLEDDLRRAHPVTLDSWRKRSLFQRVKDFASFQFREQL